MEEFVNLMLITSLLKFMGAILQSEGINLSLIFLIDRFSNVYVVKSNHKIAIRQGTHCA